jgi:SMC interacting uncharacterized protein involved in chromosome segregation
MTNYDNYVNDINTYLESEINRYYSTYASSVRQRIKDWNAQHSKVKDSIQRVEKEINGIRNRQHTIKSIISKL